MAAVQEFLLNIFKPAKADKRGLLPAPMVAPCPTASPSAAQQISRLSINTHGANPG